MYELPARVEPLAWRFLLPMVAVPTITVALYLLRRRWPGGLAAWVYSALLVLPVSGAVHAGNQLAHDRYSYLSGLGFAVVAGAAVVWVMQAGDRGALRPRIEAFVLATVVLVVGALAAGSWRQSRLWQDSETLWRWAVSVDPACALCSNNLGQAAARGASDEPGPCATGRGVLPRRYLAAPTTPGGLLQPWRHACQPGALRRGGGSSSDLSPTVTLVERRNLRPGWGCSTSTRDATPMRFRSCAGRSRSTPASRSCGRI